MDLSTVITLLLICGMLLVALNGAYNFIAQLACEVLSKPLLLFLHYSNFAPKLNIPKKGNNKRFDVNALATIISLFLIIFVAMIPLSIHNNSLYSTANVLALPAIFAFLSFIKILWISKKLPEQDIDKGYFQLKPPFAFIGDTLKKTFGL